MSGTIWWPVAAVRVARGFALLAMAFSAFPTGSVAGTPSTFTVINTDNAGAGSFRNAINQANGHPGLDRISFAIPGTGVHTIAPTGAFPYLTDPVVIDGYTQPGASPNTLDVGDDAVLLIELDGSAAGDISNGIILVAGDSTVRGLVINRYGNTAIAMEHGDNNKIQGNFVGIAPDGLVARPRVGNLSGIDVSSAGNLIGGMTPAARNVVAGQKRGVKLEESSSGNTVQGNYLGTNRHGTLGLGNVFDGIDVMGSEGNLIGGTTVLARNVVSGNEMNGISFRLDSFGNVVQGNYVGTDPTGTFAVPNNTSPDGGLMAGISVTFDAHDNLIGGTEGTDGDKTCTGACNLIAGNLAHGVLLNGDRNRLVGNFIGIRGGGSVALPNQGSGVVVVDSSSNKIGGTGPDEGNLISGNGYHGVVVADGATNTQVRGNRIGTRADGMAAVGNGRNGVYINDAANNRVGGTTDATRNLISGNGASGIVVRGASAIGNQVTGNYLGTDGAGTGDLGNALSGILLNGAPGNIVGGTAAGEGNVISGNDQDGVKIGGVQADGNKVLGNRIGTNAAGDTALPNAQNGVSLVLGASGNTIGWATPGGRNLISGNALDGVALADPGTGGNLVLGNDIGTNAAGSGAVANVQDGVHIMSAGNTIGGSTAAARNVISGNGASGVHVDGKGTAGGTATNTVKGNLIGTSKDGLAALPNLANGILVDEGAHDTVIGGGTPGARNVVSGNALDGILLADPETAGNRVVGNMIGTTRPGTLPLPNGGSGVSIRTGASGNVIGGIGDKDGNLIGFNGGNGVEVRAVTSRRNAILGNRIGVNDGLGIDLDADGVTADDDLDPDTGPNRLQNFPIIQKALSAPGQIVGSLASTPATKFRVELFANASCDTSSSNGEGEQDLGFVTVTTDGAGDATFDVTVTVAFAVGAVVTATATDPSGNTSEFSKCVVAG